MGKITSEQAEEMKKRVIAHGGSVVNYTLTEKQCRAIAERRRDVSENYFGKLEGSKPKKSRLNKTELAFYDILKGQYGRVQPHGIRLELADHCTYLPDFYCVDGKTIHIYETKGGFTREDGWIKLKMAARHYPEFTFFLAVLKKGEWKITEVSK